MPSESSRSSGVVVTAVSLQGRAIRVKGDANLIAKHAEGMIAATVEILSRPVAPLAQNPRDSRSTLKHRAEVHNPPHVQDLVFLFINIRCHVSRNRFLRVRQ